MMAIDFGTSRRPIASSLVMMRLRSISMPGTLLGADPVETTISLRARSVCVSPSKTSMPPLPVSLAVPLIQSILFFLKRNSTPLVSPLTTRSFRAWTCVMLMATSAGVAGGLPTVTPQSLAFCTIFIACACSRSALVGMQPQSRQVPPSAFCFSTTATFRPSCAARIAATYPPVPAPITTTSYSFVTFPISRLGRTRSFFQRGQGDERDAGGAGLTSVLSRRRVLQLREPRAQLAVLVSELPVRLGEPLEPSGQRSRAQKRHQRQQQRATCRKPLKHQQISYLIERLATVSTACHNTGVSRPQMSHKPKTVL